MSNIDKSKYYQPSGKAYFSQSGWIKVYQSTPKKRDSCFGRLVLNLIGLGLILVVIILLSLA